MKKPNFRTQRLNAALRIAMQHILATSIELDGVCVGQTKLNDALTLFKVSVSVFTGDIDAAMNHLNAQKAHIRYLLTKHVSMRFMPELCFVKDSTVNEVMKMVELCDRDS